MNSKEIRRQNLMALVATYRSIKQFAEFAEMNESHVSQIKSGASKIGDRLARKIEHNFSKEEGWMDKQHDAQVQEERQFYNNNKADRSPGSLNLETAERAAAFLLDQIGFDGMKSAGPKWCAQAIVTLYDLFSDPASEKLKPSTIMRIIKKPPNDTEQ